MKRGLELDRQINTKNKKDKGSRNEDEGRDKEKGN
jgi:hypothetical protein